VKNISTAVLKNFVKSGEVFVDGMLRYSETVVQCDILSFFLTKEENIFFNGSGLKELKSI